MELTGSKLKLEQKEYHDLTLPSGLTISVCEHTDKQGQQRVNIHLPSGWTVERVRGVADGILILSVQATDGGIKYR